MVYSMFIVHLNTKFKVPNSNCSFIIAVKRKADSRFHTAPVLFFYINITLPQKLLHVIGKYVPMSDFRMHIIKWRYCVLMLLLLKRGSLEVER
jgi:hypothetical protein